MVWDTSTGMQTVEFGVDPRVENPWWDSGDVSLSERYQQERRSDFRYKIGHVRSSRFVALAGAAGSGKTTILHQIANDLIEDDGVHPQNIMYLPLGDPRFQIGDDIIQDAVEEFATYHWRQEFDPREGYVLVDDAHACNDWSTQIHTCLEQHENLTVVVTLPTLARVDYGQLEALDGTFKEDVLLPPKFYDVITENSGVEVDKERVVEMRESLERAADAGDPEQFYSKLTSVTSSIESISRVQRGVLDYIRGDHREVLGDSVGNNNELTVYRDIPRYQQFDDRSDLLALCAIAAMNPGQTLGLKDLSEVLACDRRTLQRYIDVLEDFFLLTPSYQYEYERRRSVRMYLRDPLILGSILDLDLTRLLDVETEQRLTTVAVFDHLKRLGFNFQSGNAQVWFWESGGIGIDFVVETGDGTPIPIVTTSTSGSRDPSERIGTFCSEHECDFGIHVRRDISSEITGNMVTIPLWLFLLFI